MSSGVVLLMVFGAIGYMLKVVLEESLRRLGARLAGWVFPEHRPTTYRLARGICRLAVVLAPSMSAARNATSGALGDIDEIERDRPDSVRALPIACSVIVPAARARASVLLRAGALALCLLVGVLVPILNLGPVALALKYAVTGGYDSSNWGSSPAQRAFNAASCGLPLFVLVGGAVLLQNSAGAAICAPLLVSGATGSLGLLLGLQDLEVRRRIRRLTDEVRIGR